MLQGLATSIPPEDHFRMKLTELKHIGLQWADRAKKVQKLLCLYIYTPKNFTTVLWSKNGIGFARVQVSTATRPNFFFWAVF